MRKWNSYKNMNRNSTMVNHLGHIEDRNNAATPNIVINQLWLQENTTQVEIIELDSDDSAPDLDEQDDFDNIWNYLDKDRFALPQQDSYHPNENAREERRRYNSRNCQDLRGTFNGEQTPVPNDMFFTSFYDLTNDLSVKNNADNHQVNCFTIINKPFYTSESSSDDTDYRERIINSADDVSNNGIPYNDEIETFDEDLDSKRTVWIYSFKNKRVLSDNDFELVNIPSQDSASSASLENFSEERTETRTVCRVSSPIPATYVPRLNLSLTPTLPTLTEITEPVTNANKVSSNSDELHTRQRSVNNWLASEVAHIDISSSEDDKQDLSSSSNVINWMSLSPRERRRRFKHTKTGPTYQPKLPVLTEVPSSEPIERISVPDVGPNKLQVTAEVNTIETETEEMKQRSSKINLMTCKTSDQEITVVDMDDSDSDKEKEMVPRIFFNVNRTNKKKITDPLEKLSSNNWIYSDEVKQANLNESVASKSEIIEEKSESTDESLFEDGAGKRLWLRNMSLLKPVEWSEFMPITDSIPSLELSIESESRKHRWLSRLAKCFQCFK